MPLTKKGQKMMAAMQHEYGEKKGESVFYATKNKHHMQGLEAKNHSPARDVQAFNDRFLGNANVPSEALVTGGKSAPTSIGVSAHRTAGTVQELDPTANLRADYQCMDAAPNSTPSGGRSKPSFVGGRPTNGGLDSFNDAGV